MAFVPDTDEVFVLPTALAQERLWFTERLYPGTALHNMPLSLRLPARISQTVLERGLAELVRRHESLRTTFVTHDGSPRLRISPPRPLPLTVVDLRRFPRSEREARHHELATAEFRRPFDLAQGPLLRSTLVRLDDRESVLLLVMHHIVSDAWSMEVLVRELGVLYDAFSSGSPSPLPPLAIQYADWACWQRERLASGMLETHLQFWRELLRGAPTVLDLPTDRAPPERPSQRGELEPFVLDARLAARLRALAQQQGCTLYMLMLAAFGTLLARYSGRTDLLVGSPMTNRVHPEVESIIGLFVNTVVLRLDLHGEPTVIELLARVRAMVLDVQAHNEVPLDRIIEAVQPQRGQGRHPLFQVLFSLQSNASPRSLGTATAPPPSDRARPATTGTSKFELSLLLHDAPGGLGGTWEYATELFDAERIRAMTAHLTRLLEAFVDAPDTPVGRLPLATEGELRRLHRFEHGAPRRGAGRPACLHERVEQQASRTPTARAVEAGGEGITYAELWTRTTELSRRLRARGVGPDVRVGLFVSRGVDLVVGALGILHAGGAYVPLDPAHPEHRLAHIADDAKLTWVVTEAALKDQLPAGVVPLCIDRPHDAHEAAASPAASPTRPHHLAYVLYTSGTTGRPKGVAVHHDAVAALLDWAVTCFDAAARARVLASTSICFDLSAFELFLPLTEGGTVVMVENVLALASAEAPDVTLVNTVPSAMRELVRLWRPGPSLRVVCLAGEALARDLVVRLHEHAPGVTIHNLYGPTETTVYSTGTVVDPQDPRTPSIGRPIAGTRVYVLDEHLARVPLGVAGELYIAGAGVARGYLERPGLTAERYVPDPFAATPGQRMYRTGDVVCWRADGTLEYRGRGDGQIKLRGHRIELGEIEAVLRTHPLVHEAVAVLRASAGREARVVAYVKTDATGPTPDELDALVRRALPAYMVPSAFVRLEALPRTPSGKLDRAALPEPAAEREVASGRAPRTRLEATMCQLFADVLGVPHFDPDADFFAEGGHSLLAASLVARANELLGLGLPLSAIFEHPTPGELSERATELRRSDAPSLAVTSRAVGADEPIPLAFAQEGMWFYDRLRPRAALYNIPIVFPSHGPLDVGLLQASIDHVVARHDALRSCFDAVSGRPVQRRVDDARVVVVLHDLTELPPEEREGRARRIIDRESRRPFDLRRAPLLRASLVRLASHEHYVVLVMHHIIGDGWSTNVLRRELASCYEALSRGGRPELPALPMQYADYVRWQRSAAMEEILAQRLEALREQLAGAPPLVALPLDHPRPSQPSFRGDIVAFEIEPAAGEALVQRAAERGATAHMAYLAVFGALLRQYTEQPAVVVGIPMANRGRPEWRDVIGLFVNTVPLRIELDGEPTLAMLLDRVREASVSAYAREDVPFDRVVQELSPTRDPAYHPIFQVTFGFQELDAPEDDAGPREVLGATGTAKFDLSLSLSRAGRRVSCVLELATDLFERSTMERAARRYRRLVSALAAAPDRPVSEVLPLDPEERAWCEAGRRRARPQGEGAAGPAAEGGEPPASRPPLEARTDVERRIAAVWSEVLGHSGFGVDQSFFEVGGHSLAAMCVMTRIGELWNAAIPFESIFVTPTIEQLARLVEASPGTGDGTVRDEHGSIPALGRAERGATAPLSFAQERLWFLDRLMPGLPIYNIPLVIPLEGVVDVSALHRGLERLGERHECLRARFSQGEDGPVQTFDPVMAVELSVSDLSSVAPSGRRDELARRMRREARRSFDLSQGPLLHAHLVRLGAREQVLLLTIHHIVADAWSVDVLRRDLLALYEAELLGMAEDLPELTVQYADFAIWQRGWLEGPRLAAELEHWTRALAGAPARLELPTDKPRPSVQGYAGEQLPLALGAETSAALRRLAAEEGATPYMVLLAVFTAVLARWSGAADLVVGTPVIGRPRRELEELIGFFSNTLALRLRPGEPPSFRALVKHAREVVIEALAHQDVPFEAIVQELQPDRTLAHNPVFQVMFAFQRPSGGSSGAPAPAGREAVGSGTSKFDLTLFLVDDARIHGAIEYRTDLFEASTMERLAAHLCATADAAAASPDAPLRELTSASRRDRETIAQWNATHARLVPPDTTAADLCVAQVQRSPGSIAVSSDTGRLTYAALLDRASALAAHLRSLGVGEDDRVAIAAEPSTELVVATLGVWLAGAACVPIDPGYPPSRRSFMAEDCGARWCVDPRPPATRDDDGIDLGLEVVRLDDAPRPGPAAGSHRTSPDQLAYVIYTSGSTGVPKGVAVTHRVLVNLIAWQRSRPDRGGPLRTLQFASPSFDVFFQELLSCLATGGELVIASLEARRDPRLLVELCRERGIQRLFVPFVALRELAEAAAGRPPLPELREVITAGEQLQVTPALRTWFSALPRCRLLNHYGPSETHVITEECLDPDPARWPALPPIGRPIANGRLYVLDADLRPLPIGVPGDLYLGGIGLARGYLDRPELTAARFVPDPFATEPGARMYRSGDRARWLADGRVEFLGRDDDQVKIRGYRVELGEVETALARRPGVRQAIVAATPGPDGDKRLVGYVLCDDPDVDPNQLRQDLRTELPDPLVPAVLVVVDELPRTPSGKIDRRALPAPRGAARAASEPTSELERTLVRTWCEVLGLEQVALDDDFFALGGHSLSATRVTARLGERLGVEVPVRLLFEHSTIAGLAAVLQRAVPEPQHIEVAGVATELVARPRDGGPLPCSFAQERLWFIDRVAPGSPAYDLTTGHALPASLDVELLRRSLDELVRRHEALRTVFREVDGAPVQIVMSDARAAVEILDLSWMSAREQDAEIAHINADESRRSFDLAAGPLFRATLIGLGPRGHVLLLSMHHIISDAWSLRVLHRDLLAIYQDLDVGRPPSLPRLRLQYADFADWQRRALDDAVLERLVATWREHLAGAPHRLELHTDRPGTGVRRHRGAIHAFELPAALVDPLRALARDEKATLFMTMLAVFFELLHRYSRREDFLVGTPLGARPRAELEDVVGLFVNTLVLRANLTGDPSFRDLLRRVRAETIGAHSRADLPFERLVEALQPRRDLGLNPLVQVAFGLNHAAELGIEASEARGGRRSSGAGSTGNGTAKFDLSLVMLETEGDLSAVFEYDEDLFDAATVARMAAHFEALVKQAALDPDRRLSRWDLVTAHEASHVMGAQGPRVPASRGLAHLVAEHARRASGSPAVEAPDGSLTYGQLDAHAARLARTLRDMGVGPEVRVGVCLGNSVHLPVALLAIARAGGVYVPLDPALPKARLGFIVGDAAVRVVITDRDREASLAELRAPILCPESLVDAPALASEPPAVPHPEHVAYIVYTSGSTGRPKGVMVTHGGWCHLLTAQLRTLGLRPSDRILKFATPSFDASVFELSLTFGAGATLCLEPQDALLPGPSLVELLRRRAITMVTLPPSSLGVLPVEPLPALRLLFVAGEACSAELVSRWAGGRRMINGYGPTETTVWATWADCVVDGRPPPIGKPLPNVVVRVLDDHLRPVPVGVPGELFVAGPMVARGYVGRPDLTAAAFIPDPSGPPGSRMYRTGDLVRWRPDGGLDFLGRIDAQVKLRGVRIEPGEIEAAVSSLPGVAYCVVVLREDQPGNPALVAYVVPGPGERLDGSGLRRALEDRLPRFLVPSRILMCDELPRTPSGKVDRNALPVPPREIERGPSPPPGTVEEVVCRICAEVLGVPVRPADNFFDLGGHSLLLTRVSSRIRDELGTEVPLRRMFEAATLAELCQGLVTRGSRTASTIPRVPRVPGVPSRLLG